MFLFTAISSGYCTDEKTANFILYISNQSLDIKKVDVKVYLDGNLVVDQVFDVGGRGFPGHNYKAFYFNLSKGPHIIRAETKKGKATIEQNFVIGDKNWAGLDYWYDAKSEKLGSKSGKRQFMFSIQDKPIGFL